ncbi:MAG: biliverdin-producing heme oxygenase [Chloroflexi bacterium]|nr:biliverdin-producing heme oxygenase [Chloroflexota bacterium]
MDRLRTETQDRHRQVEAQPFFNALAAKDLPLESYVGLLRALETVYATLEAAASAATHPAIAAVWQDSMRKLPLLQRDLAYFTQHSLPEMPVATLYALLLADEIRRAASDDPAALLGYLYVFEGSTLGGIVLRSQVAQAFKLKDRNGLAYLSSYDKQIAAEWREFSRRMSAAPLTTSEQDRIVATADQTFAGMTQIVQGLYPIPKQEMAAMVQALNPEAGHHVIADDPREIEAALRAGERSWRQVPYYEWRYGERGRRFTWSDSSWIVTLSRHSEAVATHQLDWLSRVLASRGMPRWLLEQHLQVLHDELVSAIPENRHTYALLAHQSARLRDLRHQQLDEPTFQALAAEFAALVGSEWAERFAGTGYLLVAAVADERAGIKSAVTSVEGALTDPQQFPQPWIDAVHGIIDKARKAE